MSMKDLEAVMVILTCQNGGGPVKLTILANSYIKISKIVFWACEVES